LTAVGSDDGDILRGAGGEVKLVSTWTYDGETGNYTTATEATQTFLTVDIHCQQIAVEPTGSDKSCSLLVL